MSDIPNPEGVAICARWLDRIGLGFHPDTPGADYVPPLSPALQAEYEGDMQTLFAVALDPYACGLAAMAPLLSTPEE